MKVDVNIAVLVRVFVLQTGYFECFVSFLILAYYQSYSVKCFDWLARSRFRGSVRSALFGAMIKVAVPDENG